MSESTPTLSVLFVGLHNAGRSPMAAGFLRHYSHGAIDVRTAGALPSQQVDPVAVAAMAEVGIDISDAWPKPVTYDRVEASDVVVTMGCEEDCPPLTPPIRHVDWPVPDPEGRDLDGVREIRDEIDALVRDLLAELR